MKYLPLTCLALSSLLLGACNVLPSREPVDLYQLPPATLAGHHDSHSLDSLRLLRPGSSDALGSSRLLVLDHDHRFSAWPDARWSAPIPVLWRDWLLDAFWRDGRVQQLSTNSDGLQARLELGGMLRAFHIEDRDGVLRAVIRYDAQLVDSSSRRIVASRRFDSQVALDNGRQVSAAVRALGQAADRLGAELVDWTLQEAQSL